MISQKEDTSGFAALANERDMLIRYLTQHMRETLNANSGLLFKTSEHVLSSPGKLLRPLLLLDACRAVGGDPANAFPAAAGTEYGQIASLIHDDIIDGDSQRRGQETLHIKYDLGSAILTGDLLIFQLFLSYTECAELGAEPSRVLTAIRILSKTCIEMCEGQALEATLAGQLDTTEETYLDMIRLKTASVFRAAAKIGACLGGGSQREMDLLADYGHSLGMAFQIIDDILSFQGDSMVTGKPVTSDLRNQRITLPIIYALESGGPGLRKDISDTLQAKPHNGASPHSKLLDLVEPTGAIGKSRDQASTFINKARENLAALPESEARERLYTLADYFLTRDR